MKIALVGATGFVGSNLLREALTRGHAVTAIVRNPAKLTETNDRLTVVQGDVTHVGPLAAQLAGHDVVLSAVNPGWDNPNICADSLAGSKNIETAAEQAGVPRLVVIGGAAASSSTASSWWTGLSSRPKSRRAPPRPATTSTC